MFRKGVDMRFTPEFPPSRHAMLGVLVFTLVVIIIA